MTKIKIALGMIGSYGNFWMQFAEHAGLLTRHDYQLHLRNGLRFAVRGGTSDGPIIDEVFVKGIYDQALNRLAPGSVVIDIGGQSGVFSVAAAVRGASVYTQEPLPVNIPHIRLNAQLNGVGDKVTVNDAAVAGQRGEAELMYRDGDTGGSTLYQAVHREWEGDATVKRIKVRVITLADLFERLHLDHCDCLKLDCEGAEYDILLSQPPELARVSTLVLEYHPNGDIDELRRALTAAGFAVSLAPDSDTLYAMR